jgi:hypothetical protein
MKCGHIQQVITLTSDNIQWLALKSILPNVLMATGRVAIDDAVPNAVANTLVIFHMN